ncbi:MAG: DUF1156 domain-containing protein, partial [Anaerolineae bacterium]|nr:DUF1156 domain-containing protein [Anaerolineae bacterium]
WWARRPLAACRAVIFTSLVDDPDDPEAPPEFVAACRRLPQGKNAAEEDTPRRRLFDFIERLVLWESTTDEKVLETARELIRLATDGNPPPLLDPFAGGGSIPLEAQRLGLEAHASDLNPVAVMINKALIEIPPKFANQPPVNPRDRQQLGGDSHWPGATGLAADVRYYGEWMRDKAYERIGHLYPDYNGETVIAWLWARTVRCPNPACGAMMPLVRSFELSKKKDRRIWVMPHVDIESRKITFEIKTGKGKTRAGTVDRRGATCLACETAVPFDYIRNEGKAGRLSTQLMATVTESSNGRSYYSPSPEHEHIAEVPIPLDAPLTNLPKQALSFRVQAYGMTQHRDLFTPRQLTALTTFSALVAEVRQQIEQDAQVVWGELGRENQPFPLRDGGLGLRAYSEAVSLYLAFGVDRVADYCSTLTVWSTSRDQLIHTFTRQALPMTWDFPEVNVFAGAAGDFYEATNSISKIIPELAGASTAKQADAANLQTNNNFAISTDPPYYDNIGYADLSDFFYIWLRTSVKDVYPEIFGTMLVPKAPELIASPYRFGGDKEAAERHFETGLNQAFARMQKIITHDYPLTVYYAFKQQEIILEEGAASTGWETMLTGLIDTGFQIFGTWPMRTERNTGVKKSVNALASSIVLVCRPRADNAPMTSRREFVNALRRELPAALHKMQSGSIAPVDLAQASIGPGMAVYSRYRKVLEPDGSRLPVRTALQLINHELDAYLAEQEGSMDQDSRFAVSWFEQFGFKEAGFGQADVLARAKNTSVDGLVNAGILEAGAGKVRLLGWEELDPGWDPTTDSRLTVWETTHHLIQELDTRGEAGAARLLAKLPPDLAAEARQLAYRLYSICERKGWAEPARDYNALVISWNASQEQATQMKSQAYEQGSLFPE